MRTSIIIASLLVIAACSPGQPAPAESEAPKPVPGTAIPVGVPSAAAQPPVVPAQFQGIWDDVKGSCDPASEMRTEIAERGITFYESHGAVTGLAVDSPNRITVDLAIQGEGEKWTMSRTLTLSEGGTILTPTGGGDTGEPMPLKRCA